MSPFSSKYPELSFGDLRKEYNYIIAGGGTAGCVLANRLSIPPDRTVLLIECGPWIDSWASRVPLLSCDFDSDNAGLSCQKRMSEYQPELGRQFQLVNGTGLGGTTRINAMLYTRGLPREFDLWAEYGCKGWAWKDVEPYFRKSERSLDGDESFHGKNGEWKNQTAPLWFPSFHRVIDVCREFGLSFIDDVNSPNHPPVGCAKLHYTRDENQHRHSVNRAFLPTDLVKQRPNLHILTNTMVEKVLITQGKMGPVAQGVQVTLRSSTHRRSILSRNEIILCAGPFGTPQILMLSGIGPSDHLNELGIHVHKDLPAVGENLQDHFGAFIAYRVPMHHSFVSIFKIWIFFLELFRWLVWGTGLFLVPLSQLTIFVSTSLMDFTTGLPVKEKKVDSNTLPDLEIMPMTFYGGDAIFDRSSGIFSILCFLLQPKSKGNLRLTSRSPGAPVKIDPRYLSNHADFVPLRMGIKFALRLAEQMHAGGYPIENWPAELPAAEDDITLDKFIRSHSRSTYHYSSTCRMGHREDVEDGGAVVDEELKVFGVGGLRVADSSVFPWVLGTHLQAPTVMVAERCADFILNNR